jgi:hypothetical protein
MASEHELNSTETRPESVRLPAPTAWPVVLAFGLTLVWAGLLTTIGVSILGAILAVAGCVGWFRQLLPHEQHETVPVKAVVAPIVTERREVARIPVAHELHRARIPLEIYPISSGIKGGLAGSVAMAVLAVLYGVVKYGSIWYPINLLASIVYAQALQMTTAQISAFRIELLLVATVIHLAASVLMGVLYGALLPIFPRRPILLGGFIAPIMWSGLLYFSLGIINPLLDQRIDWLWFVITQIGFGIVAGLVVVRQERVRTGQYLPFAVRARVETPGVMEEKKEEGPNP